MTDAPDFDEPDFAKHLHNVLTDLCEGQLDGVEEAHEAIMLHPAIRDVLSLKVIGPLE